jgi:hypothetical protein
MGLPTIAIPEYSLTVPSSGQEVKYRPFLVKEEKILLLAMESEDQKQIMQATKTVIGNCVVGDYDLNTLATFDIEYIFLWLRGKSKGEEIDLKYTCPECKNPIDANFNIEDVKIRRIEGHNKKIELTDKLGVVMKYPNMDMQELIDDVESKDKSQIEIIFKSIITCIDYIYDEEKIYAHKDHTLQELEAFLDSLTDTNFKKISMFFETMPALKHTISIKCLHSVNAPDKSTDKKTKKAKTKVIACGYTEDIVLEGLASFFE